MQKLWNSWRLKSQGLLLHELPLLKGVNSVCKFVGFSWKLAWCSHTKVCKAWAKLIYFYQCPGGGNNPNIFYCPTWKQIFSGTNRNIRKSLTCFVSLLSTEWYCPVCFEACGIAKAGNSIKQTLSELKPT